MPAEGKLSADEEKLLAAIGYLSMRWNFAEYSARQILRSYLTGRSLYDLDHIALSKKQASWIENELRDVALPKWKHPGRPYLSCLIDAYAAAPLHRNQKIHGIYATSPGGGSTPARATLLSSKPIDGEPQAAQTLVLADLMELHDPFVELGEFAQKVMVGFDKGGGRRANADGTFVIDPLPAFIAPLAAPKSIPLMSAEQKVAYAKAKASKG